MIQHAKTVSKDTSKPVFLYVFQEINDPGRFYGQIGLLWA